MTNFIDVSFVHERREANSDAHKLAKESLYENIGRHVWLLAPLNGVCTTINIP